MVKDFEKLKVWTFVCVCGDRGGFLDVVQCSWWYIVAVCGGYRCIGVIKVSGFDFVF